MTIPRTSQTFLPRMTLLILDFDGVVIDGALLKQRVLDHLAQVFSMSKEEVSGIYDSCHFFSSAHPENTVPFNPRTLFVQCGRLWLKRYEAWRDGKRQRLPGTSAQLEDLYRGMEALIRNEVPKLVYPDAKEFLQKVASLENVHALILTFGDDQYQQLKVDVSGARQFVQEVIVTQQEKALVIARYLEENISERIPAFFIDDQARYFCNPALPKGVCRIHMVRTETAEGQDHSCCDKDVCDLHEAFAYIRELRSGVGV